MAERQSRATRFPGISKITRAGASAPKYMVSYRVPGIGQRTKTFRTISEARDFQAKMRDPVRSREERDLQRGSLPIDKYFPEWLNRKRDLSPSTIVRYEGVGRLYVSGEGSPLAGMPIQNIHRDDVEDWISWMVGEGVGLPTIDKAYRTIRACLGTAEQEGKVLRNPARKIHVPALVKRESFYLTSAEVEAVASEVSPRHRCLVIFLAFTGARIGEASALRVRNLDLMKGTVHIRENSPEVKGIKIQRAKTKTKQDRVVALPQTLIRELAVHLEEFGPRASDDHLEEDGYVFTSDRGGQVRQGNWRTRVFQPACRCVGITRVREGKEEAPRVHDLRHTAASLAAHAGLTLYQVKEMLGHSSIKITADLYLHLFIEDKVEGAKQLDLIMQEASETSHANGVVLNHPLRNVDEA